MLPKGRELRRAMPKGASANVVQQHLGITKKISVNKHVGLGGSVCFCCIHETSGIPEPPRPPSKHKPHTHTHENNDHTLGPPFTSHPFTPSSKSISRAVTLSLSFSLSPSPCHGGQVTVLRDDTSARRSSMSVSYWSGRLASGLPAAPFVSPGGDHYCD